MTGETRARSLEAHLVDAAFLVLANEPWLAEAPAVQPRICKDLRERVVPRPLPNDDEDSRRLAGMLPVDERGGVETAP